VDVASVLKAAWASVQEADLPDDLRGVAFTEAVRLLAPQTAPALGLAAAAAGSGDTGTPQGQSNGGAPDQPEDGLTEEKMYDALEHATSTPRAKLEALLHLHEGTPQLSVNSGSLKGSVAAKMRLIAQVIAVTRVVALHEQQGVSLEAIRAECERLHTFDVKNFSTQVKKVDGLVMTGSGKNTLLKVKPAAISSFADTVTSILPD